MIKSLIDKIITLMVILLIPTALIFGIWDMVNSYEMDIMNWYCLFYGFPVMIIFITWEFVINKGKNLK